MSLVLDGSNTLCIIGGKVGIGISNPTYPLDVASTYYYATSPGNYGYVNGAGSIGYGTMWGSITQLVLHLAFDALKLMLFLMRALKST